MDYELLNVLVFAAIGVFMVVFLVAVFCRIDADQTWRRAQIVSGAGSPSVRWVATPSTGRISCNVSPTVCS